MRAAADGSWASQCKWGQGHKVRSAPDGGADSQGALADASSPPCLFAGRCVIAVEPRHPWEAPKSATPSPGGRLALGLHLRCRGYTCPAPATLAAGGLPAFTNHWGGPEPHSVQRGHKAAAYRVQIQYMNGNTLPSLPPLLCYDYSPPFHFLSSSPSLTCPFRESNPSLSVGCALPIKAHYTPKRLEHGLEWGWYGAGRGQYKPI